MEVGQFYNSYLKLIEFIKNRRDKDGVHFNDIPNFIFSIHMSYKSQSIDEIGDDCKGMIEKGLEMIKNGEYVVYKPMNQGGTNDK